MVFEGLAGLMDRVTDAGGGDLEQVGEHIHRSGLPLVEEGEQDAGLVAGQRLDAQLAGGPAGTAAALGAVTLLDAGCLERASAANRQVSSVLVIPVSRSSLSLASISRRR
jgi:hypothetical protein